MSVPTRFYACSSERRRAALVRHLELMGIDYLEVLNDRRRPSVYLMVHLVPNVPAEEALTHRKLTARNIKITGGTRIADTRVMRILYPGDLDYPEDRDHALAVEVGDEDSADGVGDFSPHTLRLVEVSVAPDSSRPTFPVDPAFSQVTFSFKAERSGDFDCRPTAARFVESLPEPETDYLAKDYASFRRLVLDRLSVLMPEWEERNPADLQIALVELLAYVGDHLSYQQDSTATEAYLGTARRRVSVRRHARLVDYFMHDGSSARVWVQVQTTSPNGVQLKRGTQIITRTPDLPPGRLGPDSPDAAAVLSSGAEVFETMHDATLYKAHNELRFYTWGNEECCLPHGTTRATLMGDLQRLVPGEVLILEEVRGPLTGVDEDADPTRRHAVCLTGVSRDEDPLLNVPITEIEWAAQDALPFPLCISARRDNLYFENVSVARGNIVLADHGRTIPDEHVGVVPASPPMQRVPLSGDDASPTRPILPRFRPHLEERPLTHAALYEQAASATAAMEWAARDVLPAVALTAEGIAWIPRRDLLGSEGSDTHFVVEVEDDGTAYLRFGDGRFGLRPTPGTAFDATYRVGNGAAGNIGAEALAHVISDEATIVRARNPLPARGGTDPESIEQVRQDAPSAFRIQERAVTPEDYAEVAQRHPKVQRAAATVRWTGSWRTIFLSVDRLGGRDVDVGFEEEMRRHLEPYRMIGHDLEIEGPHFVPLEIVMLVHVRPDYLRTDVRTALLETFSGCASSDGRPGVFHPDNFTFGQAVHLSPLYAAAQALEGVAAVEIQKFQRWGVEGQEAIRDGLLQLERLEVARLDNDPNFPERGTFQLIVEGGR